MNKYEIRMLKREEYKKWDRLVDYCSAGTIFHKSYLLKIFDNAYIYGVFLKNGELIGGFPIVFISKFGIRMLKNPPLIPYLGLILKDKIKDHEKYISRLSREKEVAMSIAKIIKRNHHYIDIIFPPFGEFDLQPFIWENFSTNIQYTYILDLTKDLEEIWNEMSKKQRNAIRKAEKDGIVVELSNNIDEILQLATKTFQKQGKKLKFKSLALKYHENLLKRDQCKAFISKDKDGIAIAGVYIVYDKRRAYYLIGGHDPDRSHYGATALALWEAIKFAKNTLELIEFDFEGSMIPQIERFFRGFGGKLKPIFRIKFAKHILKLIPISALMDIYMKININVWR